jgi:hypothetical protein
MLIYYMAKMEQRKRGNGGGGKKNDGSKNRKAMKEEGGAYSSINSGSLDTLGTKNLQEFLRNKESGALHNNRQGSAAP